MGNDPMLKQKKNFLALFRLSTFLVLIFKLEYHVENLDCLVLLSLLDEIYLISLIKKKTFSYLGLNQNTLADSVKT